MASKKQTVYVIQHTDSEYLGRIEDHLEGRGIRFTYLRPHTAAGTLPSSARFAAGLVLLGGGPWGSAGGRDLPTLGPEISLVKECLAIGTPVIGIGLGAQILAIAAGGGTESAELVFEVGEARRVEAKALDGFLPESYPLAIYMRDRPIPPEYARILAEDWAGRPALFQIGENCFGFTGHPGAKRAMFEDLIMEFEEAPEEAGPGLEAMSSLQPALEDALVHIMTGIIRQTRWMKHDVAP